MRRFIATLGNAIKSAVKTPAKSATIKQSQPNTPPLFETLESRELFSGGIQTGPIKVKPPVALDAIQAKYQSLGGAKGSLGKAETGELPTEFGGGLYEVFQGGDIFWSAKTGAHVAHVAISAEYQATAHQTDYNGTNVQRILGLPTGDEMNIPGVHGRMTTFESGTIYWSAPTGAHVVYGAISGLYYRTGGPAGFLGLPTSDEQAIPGGRVGYFQNGKIIWTPQRGAYSVKSVSFMFFGTGNISFGGGFPVGGSAELTVYADGSYHFRGHFSDWGVLGYNDCLVFGLESPSGVLYTFAHAGHMAGALDFGSHDDNWDVTGTNTALATGWADLEGAKAHWGAATNSDFAEIVSSIAQKIEKIVLAGTPIVNIFVGF